MEVGPEVEATEDAGLIARAHIRAALDDVVQPIKAGGAEVLVVRMHLLSQTIRT